MKNVDVDLNSRVGKFTKIASNIGEIAYNGNIDITANEMEQFLNGVYTEMDHMPFYLINKVKKVGSFPREVWEFLGTDILHNHTIIASAITSNSIGYTMQTKHFFNEFPLKYPVKLFQNKKEATNWIEELKLG